MNLSKVAVNSAEANSREGQGNRHTPNYDEFSNIEGVVASEGRREGQRGYFYRFATKLINTVLITSLFLLPLFYGGKHDTVWGLYQILLGLVTAYVFAGYARRGLFSKNTAAHEWFYVLSVSGVQALSLCLFAFVLIATIQVVPLPLYILEVISPATASIVQSAGLSWGTLSFDVNQSLISLGWFSTHVALIFLVLARPIKSKNKSRIFAISLGAKKKSRRRSLKQTDSMENEVLTEALTFSGVQLILWSCAFLAVIGLFHLALGVEKLFFFFDPERSGLTTLRAHWPFVNPNHLAAFLELGICLLFGYLMISLKIISPARLAYSKRLPGMRQISIQLEQLPKNVLGFFLLLFVFLALFLTMSKAGIALAFVAFLTTYFISESLSARARSKLDGTPNEGGVEKVLKSILKGGGLILATFLLMIFLVGETRREALVSRYEYRLAESDEIRVGLFQATTELITDFPLFGVGNGCWNLAIPAYIPEGLSGWYHDYAHNDVIQLIAEFGLLGGVVFALAALLILREFFKCWGKSIGLYNRGILLGLMLALTIPLIHGLFDFHFRLPAFSIAYCLILGLFFRLTTFLQIQSDKLASPTRIRS